VLSLSAAQTILYTSLPCAVLIVPFVFVTREPLALQTFLDSSSSSLLSSLSSLDALVHANLQLSRPALAALALGGGSALVVVYVLLCSL
jgi:hypothetical protein